MTRIARIKFAHPEDGYYHIVSRTVQQSFLLGDVEKEYFKKLLRWLSQVYFVRVGTFAVMSNHFHLIIQMIPSHSISKDDFKKRYNKYYNVKQPLAELRVGSDEEAPLLERWGDVSCFLQELKQRFSRWYNKRNKSYGHVWADRFKSVLLEGDRALLACMVYVELNSVRAGLVTHPEEYRFSGLSLYCTGGRAACWLDHDTLAKALKPLEKISSKTRKDLLRHYLEVIYHEGMLEVANKASIPEKEGELLLSTDFKGAGVLTFKRRIRYFTDGIFLGSQTFCEDKFREFRSYFQTRNDRRTGRVFRYSTKKRGSIAAPSDNLLHLHSIRTFPLRN